MSRSSLTDCRGTLKRALLVGIDEYDDYNNLSGCVNDVESIEPLLARNEDGSPNFSTETRISTTSRITRDSLLSDLDALLQGGADVALLYFAGHGSGRGNDVSVVTTDATQQTPGVSLSEILTKAQDSSVKEVIILLDCCFAGAAGGVPQLGTQDASLRSGLTILAASRGDQTAAETAEHRGLFSTYLEGALDGGAADVLGKVTIAGIYAYLDESFGAWDQRPVLKANVDRLHELRRCHPAVALEELRRLPEFFPDPDHQFPLDPSYEPDAGPKDEQHEADFATLQRCTAAHLVVPVDADHMYFAAMQNKSCRLTPLGKRYRHMAEQGLI